MSDRMAFDLSLKGDLAAKLKEASKAAGVLGDDLDKTKTKGERIADGIRAGSQAIIDEAKQAQTAIDALSAALGPELTAKANAGGAGVAGLVQDLQRVGLTYQEIAQDADKLGAAMRDADSAAGGMTSTVNSLGDVEQAAKSAADAVDKVGTAGAGGAGLHDTASGAKDLEEGMRKVGHETDRTRSVMANFTGNAIQELPGVTGAMGPLNMALGQFAEYGAEGNIKLGSLLASGLALGAVSVVLNQIGNDAKKVAEIKAFDAKQVDDYTHALRDGKSAAAAFVAEVEKAGKVEVTIPAGFSEAFDMRAGWQQKLDITDVLVRNSVSMAVFAHAVEGGQKGIDNLEAALRAGGASAKDISQITAGASDQMGKFATATERTAALNKLLTATQDEVNAGVDAFLKKKDPIAQFPAEFARIASALNSGTKPAFQDVNTVTEGLGVTIDDVITKASDLAKTTADAAKESTAAADEYLHAIQDTVPTVEMEAAAEKVRADALKDATKAQDDATKAAQREEKSIRDEASALRDAAKAAQDAARAELDRVDAMRASADANFAVADATDNWKDSVAGLTKAVAEAKKNHKDLDTVYRANTATAATFADKIVQLRVDLDASNGVTTTAKDKTDLFNKSMIDMATSVKGPARQSILDFIVEANNIPDAKVTDIQVAANKGDWAAVKKIIDDTSKAREAAITAKAWTDQADQDLNDAAKKDRTADIIAAAITGVAAGDFDTFTAKERLAYIHAQVDTAEAETQLLALQRQFRQIAINAVLGGFSGLKAPGGATGVRYRPGEIYNVAEAGRSELLHEGGQTFLLAGASGVVEPLPTRGATGGTPSAVSFSADHISHTTLSPAAAAAVSAPAGPTPEEVAKAAKDAADAAIAEQDRVKAAEFELGRITSDQYSEYLKQREAGATELSVEWLTLHRQIKDLADAEQKAADDKRKADKDAADAAIAQQDRLIKHEYDNDLISAEDYKAYLLTRRDAYGQYTDEWFAMLELMQAAERDSNAKTLAEQKAILDQQKSVYEQAQKERAEREAGRAQDEATNAAFEAAGKVRGARTPQDRAAAIDEATTAQQRLATAIANTSLAKAAAGGFEVGSVEWDRMMRGLLEAARGVFEQTGLDEVLRSLDDFLQSIPAMATGGYVPGTPRGTIIRAGENNVGELVGPPNKLGGTVIHNHVHLTPGVGATVSQRDIRNIQSALNKHARLNGRG